LIDEFDEKRLKEIIISKIRPETIVISACHSSRLAEIFLNKGTETTTIIAINSKEIVLEKAS